MTTEAERLEALRREMLLMEQRRAMESRAAEIAAQPTPPAPTGGVTASPEAMAAPERGFGAMLYDNVVGNPDDGVTSPGERIGTWLNRAGETMTLGVVGDEAAAAATGMLPGRSYEGELERYRGNEEAMSGVGRLAADLTGGLTGALAAPVGTLARGASLGSRMASSIGAGAGMGGAYGFMEGEGGLDERAQELAQGAAVGAIAGAAAPVIGAGVQRVADSIAGNRAIRAAAAGAPSTDELRAMGQSAYRQIDDAGVRIRPDVVRRNLDDIATGLDAEGTRFSTAPRVLPQASAVRSTLGEVGEGANGVPFGEIDQLRRFVGAAGANADAAATRGAGSANDTRLVTGALGQIDDMVNNLGPNDVDAGDIQTLQDVLPRAREIWARMSRSQTVDDAIEASENYLSGPASGLRNQFRRIVSNPRLSRGFSDAELQVMRRVAQGSIPERIVYNVGSGLGQVGSTLAGGALGLGGGPAGSVTGMLTGAAISGGAARMAEGLARRNAEVARAIIANGRLPAHLPVASDANRRIVEELMRRGAATAGAQ